MNLITIIILLGTATAFGLLLYYLIKQVNKEAREQGCNLR